MSGLDVITAAATALKNGSEGAFSPTWNEDDAEAGFWINREDYLRLKEALDKL